MLVQRKFVPRARCGASVFVCQCLPISFLNLRFGQRIGETPRVGRNGHKAHYSSFTVCQLPTGGVVQGAGPLTGCLPPFLPHKKPCRTL